MSVSTADRLKKTRRMIVLAMLGTLTFLSKLVLAWAPNIHLVGMLTMAYTIVYRKYALIPIYIFVMLDGLYQGFSLWCMPYLYIWTILWAVTMLLPRNMPLRVALPVYTAVCALYGLSFGTLYSPAHALLMGLSFKSTLAWIAAGLPYDALHAVGNLAAGTLILPVTAIIRKCDPE